MKCQKKNSTQTRTSVTVSDNSLTTLDTAEVQRLSNTINKIFSKKLFAFLTGKDAILKEVRDCVLRNDEARLMEISP